MSAAAAPPAGDAPVAAKKGSKKLIIIIVAVVLLLAAAGGGAIFLMKKNAADEESADGDEAAPRAHAVERKKDAHKTPPTFVPLDPFVVNLADRDQERYAQIGLTLEIDDAHFADELKAYMPAIRNGILMILAHKTSEELLAREGKEKLAAEVLREAVRPLGIEIEDEEAEAAAATPGKKKKRKAPVENPVKKVHFSNFIIQ
ncbi:MAG: flagellar basal body-associated FliL family protein [Burkholderiales bacterium]|nr:flagellar basal body-associated FliL family protein [Burkholderiales bacterium]